MYITFSEALKRISNGKEYKNQNYHMTRIRSLIKNGELTEANPDEIFVRNDSGEIVSIGSIKTEPLVTVQSVNDYNNSRSAEISERGCVTKGGRPVKAIFTDGTESEFQNIGDAVRFFCITRYQLRQAITTNRPIEYKVGTNRADELSVEPEKDLTEHVKFRYC